MLLKNVADTTNKVTSIKTLMIVGLGLFVFSKSFVSDLSDALTQPTVNAAVTDRAEDCRLVIHRPGKRMVRRMTLPCDEAYALKKDDLSKKTRVFKRQYVMLSFPRADGQIQTARVLERKVGARGVPIGDQITIAYDDANPKLITKPTTWGMVFKSFLWLVACLVFLFLLLSGYQKLRFAFEHIKKGWHEATKDARVDRNERIDELIAQVEESFEPKTIPATPTPTTTAPIAASRPSQRRKKRAPIPKTNSVVSKRSDSWFG